MSGDVIDMPGPGRPKVAFRRDPGAPFDDLRKEEFAKARARGGSIRAASNVAGTQYATGLSWEKHPEMKARIREMRSGADDFVGATAGWVIGELKKNVEAARENLQFKASNEALALIYKLVNEDKDAALKITRSLPAHVQGQELQSRVMDAFNAPAPRPKKRLARNAKQVETQEDDRQAVVDTDGEPSP
jgi:hypothetical protein